MQFEIVDVPKTERRERPGVLKAAYLEAVRLAEHNPANPQGIRLNKTLKSTRSRVSELNRRLGGGLSVVGGKDDNGEYVVIFKRGAE